MKQILYLMITAQIMVSFGNEFMGIFLVAPRDDPDIIHVIIPGKQSSTVEASTTPQ